MNPLALHTRNYRCFETLDLDLPDGCVAILGPNGAGKSSIVNAIDLAIFGPASRSLADALADSIMDGELMLELQLEHAGQQYRIRRTYSPRGRGKTTLDFEVREPDGWDPLTRESVKETQALIEQTLGLSRETFRASAFLQQGDGAAFTEAQPRDRKRILAEVLGLDRYDRLLARARADRNECQAADAVLAGRLEQAAELVLTIPQLERDHTDLVDAETVHADNLADLHRSHAQAADEYQEAREHAARQAAAVAELEAAQGALRGLEAIRAAAETAAHNLTAVRAELAELPAPTDLAELRSQQAALAQQIADHGVAVRERDFTERLKEQRERERDGLQARAIEEHKLAVALDVKRQHLVEHEAATCETCGQALPDDARARAIESYRADGESHRIASQQFLLKAAAIAIPDVPTEPAPAPRAELAAVTAALDAATAGETRRATLTERSRQLEVQAAAGPSPDALVSATTLVREKQATLTLLGESPNLAALEEQLRVLAADANRVQAILDERRQQRARLEERLAAAAAAAEQAAAIGIERSRLQANLDVATALERAFSPNGIPALIVENTAIPYLETEANRILGELGTPYRVELRTQAELKSSAGLRDTLDVIVCTEIGERAYETFSGGERTRINLALRIALARLLAHRRGAESRLLAIDEPEFLDEQGTAALVDVLRGLETEFDKLYIVSHVPSLRDSFDVTLTVMRGEAGSRVLEQGAFEEVPA